MEKHTRARALARLGWRWLGRAAVFAASLLALSAAVFWLARLAPGDPLVAFYGSQAERLGPAQRAWAEQRLGLDQPIAAQYLRWLQGALRGEFGISYQYKRPVLEVIAGRLPNTLALGGLGFVLIFVLALALGLLCVWFEGRWPDRVLCTLGTAASCVPEFWLALVLLLVFSVWLGWLPSSGAYAIGSAASLAGRARHLVLPLATVVLGHVWYYAFLVRNRLLEETRAAYVLLARAAGFGRGRVLCCRCLRGILPAYLSLMAVSAPHIIGGAYVAEAVFSYPGLGALAYESARCQDYNLLMLLCLLTGAVVMLGSALAQAVSERLDPRLAAQAKAQRKGGAADAAAQG